MKREVLQSRITLLLTAVMLLALVLANGVGQVSACDPTYTEVWDDRGSDSLDCSQFDGDLRPTDGWIHWVFSTKGDSIDAQLVLGGTGSGTYAPGEPLEAEVWHFYTPYFELDGLEATIYLYGGMPGPGGGLVISDYCPGGYEELAVSKTATTFYVRTHHWSINKTVGTENGHELEGYPKIWLDGPGDEGDETATWMIGVGYEGFIDSGHVVSGSINIVNTGTLTAIVTDIEDLLAGMPVTLAGGPTLPHALPAGGTMSYVYAKSVDTKVEGFNVVTVTTQRDSYSGNAPITWGDPNSEINATVNIKDVSDLFGEVSLGTATAPNGAQFIYTKHFAWADYDRDACGQSFTYGNAAVIIETGQSASATLKVNIRCEELTVSKTAVTSYTRIHYWDIDKSVGTENGYELCGTPKIWLYTDGTGDEVATWTVDVTYEGYTDSDWNVSGEITIENTGTLPAVITEVIDQLCGTSIPVVWPINFEPGDTLGVGESIVLTYDQDLWEAASGCSNEVWVRTERDEYYASAYVVWEEPTTEVNKTVVIVDDSDLLGERELGKATAPEGATFTYSKPFAWTDYGRDLCGSYQYDNTASIVETGQSASATLKVNVQCMLFKGETAWAANANKPLEYRYTNRGNWATYAQYVPGKVSTLFAGQTIPVGTVHFSAVSGGKVTITVTLSGGWEFEDVSENLKVQDYAKAPSGNPAPGRFAHKKTCDPASNTCSITVPANKFYGVHVLVGKWMPDPNFGP